CLPSSPLADWGLLSTHLSHPSDRDVLVSPQECLSPQQALSAVRQMQKLLAAQEARAAWARDLQLLAGAGVRSSLVMSVLTCVCLSAETCPQPVVPLNGRMLGRSTRVGHDVHFVCDAGFRLVGSETRACRHDRTWSGTQPFCRSEVEQGWGVGGSALPGGSCTTPSPVTGPPAMPHSVPPDVDECQLFQSSPQTRLCLHDCLNLPGSYRCLCPPGYLLRADRNTCEDVNECTGKQHNCTQGDLCINTFGGHRCVCPKCPPPRHNTSYVKTSAFQCERNPCPMESRACRLAATSISFHYLPLQANRTVPRVLFKMSTTRFVGDSLRFAIMGGRGQGVFAVRRSDRQMGELVLTSPVAGPVTLEVDLEMSEFSRKVLLGKHIFKVTVFVSPYEF
uniref:Fibulin 7 n=1 Tax=Strix occidentalis caurina TaxID=311401 RepID=A0A8D0FB75_STROC